MRTEQQRKSARERYQRHRDEILAEQGAHRAAHREELARRQRAYYLANIETCRARDAVRRSKKRAERAAAERQRRIDHRDRIKDSERERGARARRWFQAYLRLIRREQGCADCGTRDGRLVHHHIDPSTKRYELTRMYRHSMDSIVDEIGKCTVLCNSCHTRRHMLAAGAARKLALAGHRIGD